jgi:hypothetical protein
LHTVVHSFVFSSSPPEIIRERNNEYTRNILK